MNFAEVIQFVCFGALTAIVIAAALGVVLFENIVYSGFLLGGVLIAIAGIYLLLNADFVAAAQVLIYVGAVNILIIYGIMLVNKREPYQDLPNAWIRPVATATVCAGLFALLSVMILSTPWQISSEVPAGDKSIYIIGQHFFSDYLLPFELASVLLLIAMIGAIVMARREYMSEDVPLIPGETMSQLPERPRELISAGSDRASEV